LFLLDHGQVHASTRPAHGTREVARELFLQLVPLVDRVLVQRLEACERCFIRPICVKPLRILMFWAS
jgi:hypothetical protein